MEQLAQAFCRLGTELTVFESLDRLLPLADPESSSVLHRVLESEGIQFRLGAKIERVRAGNSALVLTDRGEDIEFDALRVAVGRKPTVDGLDLESAGVNYSERRIGVDNYLRTNQRHIYACGDVIGGFQFTHYAVWQASRAVRTMLFPGSSTGVRSQMPWAVFADPEVAQCGYRKLKRASTCLPRMI